MFEKRVKYVIRKRSLISDQEIAIITLTKRLSPQLMKRITSIGISERQHNTAWHLYEHSFVHFLYC